MTTPDEVAAHPGAVTRTVVHDGERYTLRLLAPEDTEAFGAFLDGLSEATGSLFGPHPLNSEQARKLCASLDPSHVLRFGLFDREERMVGYFLLFPGIRPGETSRYAKQDIELSSETDCTFAPALADEYQSKGLGSAVMPEIFDIARSLGFSRVVLSGGTQERNTRGIAFYRKHGFRMINTFITEPAGRGKIVNHDMIKDLTSRPSEER